MTSGNHIVDQFEEDLRREERERNRLDCGCYKYCKCDSSWDEIESED